MGVQISVLWDSEQGRFMATLIKQQPGQFEGFGSSILAKVARRTTSGQPIPCDRMDARAMLHDHCPLTPGVYGWLDPNNQVCYVGKSKSLRKRLLSYFAKTPSDPKMGRIVRHSHLLVWEPVSHELLALIREQELIYRWRPDFNKQGQPTRRQPAYVGIEGGSAPKASFARRVTKKLDFLVGPIAGTSRLRSAVDCLNQVFHLRDCPDRTRFHYNDQSQLFGETDSPKCIRYELGTCPGPCASLCSKRDYQDNVDELMRFLNLEDISVLDRLSNRMKTAGANLQYERATILRDQLKHLSWLVLRLTALEESRKKLNGVLPMDSFGRRKLWLILRGGRLVGSAAEPLSANRAATALEKLTSIATQTDTPATNLMEMNFQLMIMSAFRKDTQMRKRLLTFDQAFEVCQSLMTKQLA
jgi:excinuclease ABC subunit C